MEGKTLKEIEEGQLAYNYMVRILARRDYTRLELKKKCALKGFSEIEIEKALTRVAPYLDDERVIKAMIRALLRQKKGERAIVQKLKVKSPFPEEALRRWIYEEMPLEEQIEAIREMIEKKYPALTTHKEKARAYRFLLSRGFPYEMVAKALHI